MQFIEDYKSGRPTKYDYRSDPSGEANWYQLSRDYTSAHQLSLVLPKDPALSDLLKVITTICNQYKNAIENNGLWEFLYRDDGSPKHETASQLLFYSIAFSYCDANNLSIARESNAGRGPVDFKVSDGKLNIVVDTKLSTNRHLMHAYETQLPIYERSERSSGSLIVVLKVKERSSALDKLVKRINDDRKDGIKGPGILVIDALPKESASKARR